jgi:hypothetical protein
MNNPEQLNSSQINKDEIYSTENKKQEKIKDKYETSVELSPRDIEARTEKARTEAMDISKNANAELKNKDSEKIIRQKNLFHKQGSISKKQRNDSYKKTIKQVQDELSDGNRIFSKIVHNKVIEKISDTVSNTIARPDAMLSGAFFAFIITLIVYIVAKTIGYSLSGFETIAAFIIGWIFGIIYDYFRNLIVGKKF